MTLHSSGENYLKAIWILQQEKEMVHSIDVAKYLGVSKPSVSRAVKTLRDGGYLTMDENRCLHFTEEGREIAENIYERYQYFARHLASAGIDPLTAEEEACKMEHTISEDTFQRLKERKSQTCPYADSCQRSEEAELQRDLPEGKQ